MIDLNEIRERLDRAEIKRLHFGSNEDYQLMRNDIPALIAEVERLRKALEEVAETGALLLPGTLSRMRFIAKQALR